MVYLAWLAIPCAQTTLRRVSVQYPSKQDLRRICTVNSTIFKANVLYFQWILNAEPLLFPCLIASLSFHYGCHIPTKWYRKKRLTVLGRPPRRKTPLNSRASLRITLILLGFNIKRLLLILLYKLFFWFPGLQEGQPFFVPRILTNMAAGHIAIRYKCKVRVIL